jgi:signal transduction histidine kinase
MAIQASLQEIRAPWVERISRELASGEGVRVGFTDQLERFFELLEQTIMTGDTAWLDPILYDWGRSPTETNLEQGDYYVSFILSRMVTLTIEVARERLSEKDTLELLAAVIPILAHSLSVVVRYEMETRVAHISNELGEVQEKLQLLDQNKSKFISVAAHELKTPLTLIEGYTSMMADLVQASELPQMKNYLGGVSTGIQRLRHIIDDMIDVSLIDNHLLTLNIQPLWISHLLNLTQNEFKKSLPIANSHSRSCHSKAKT